MKEALQNAATGTLVLCALAVTGLVARRELSAPGQAPPAVTEVREWRGLTATGHILGAVRPRLTVVEFSDFQCPFCARARTELNAQRRKHPEVAVVYRHFPLNGHPHAFDAAVAAECASDQGRFESYHDELFTHQDSIGVTGWDAFARRAGVPDIPQFRACLDQPAPRSRVARDRAEAARLGMRGTPTFIVNGHMFSGSTPPGGWDQWIERSLRGS